MKRIILRHADSIRFLADNDVTFTLPRGQSKDNMPKGWNLPGGGHTAVEAIAHLEKGKNVGALAEFVTILDIDFDFPQKVADLGSLAHTAKVWRDNAKERGALLYKLVDGPVLSTNWKPDGANEPHAELLAQTKTGNYKYKNVAGFHKGGAYVIVDSQSGIKEITRADLELIWVIVTGTELYAEKPAKAHTATPREHKPVDSHDDLKAQVKAYWSPLRVFEYHGWVKEGTKREGKDIRISGHSGLTCKEEEGIWYHHSQHIGGDAIDAWAHCTRRNRDRYFLEILEEMANAAGISVPSRFRPPEPAPLPEGAKVLDNGHVILKTTPIPLPAKRTALPDCTPALCAALVQTINSPDGRNLLHGLPSRTREVYVAALAVLLSKAPQLGGWKFSLNTRDLGVLLGKTKMSASRNLHALARVQLVDYRHAPARTEIGDAPPMTIDLSPIARQLLDVTGVNNSQDVTEVTIPYTCNVYARYAGGGEFADATMRANPMVKGLHGRILRNLSASALNGLDLVARGELALTRRQLVEELGMSAGSAAGATRVYIALGIATAEKNGRVTEYVFEPDWQERLQAQVPKMVSFLASYRLKIGNVSDRIVEVERHIRQAGGDPKHIREEDSQLVRDMHTRRKKMLFARQYLINEMEAADLANRPDTPTTAAPPSLTPVAGKRRKPVRRLSEGELIERRLALYATARPNHAVAA